MLSAILASTVPKHVFAEDGSPTTRAETLLTAVAKGQIDAGFDRFFEGSEIVKSKSQAVDLLKAQTKNALPLYGTVLSFEKVIDKNYGSSITRLVYIVKMERHPLVWEFYFYKPTDHWKVSNVFFNDQFQGLREGP